MQVMLFFLWKLLNAFLCEKCVYFCKLSKWVEYLFQVFIYNTKIGELQVTRQMAHYFLAKKLQIVKGNTNPATK